MINIYQFSALVCTACSTATQEHNYTAVTMTAVLAHVSWLDDTNVFGHFTVEEHQKASHIFPPVQHYDCVSWGISSIKVGCPFAMCITLEIHNMIYLYTISFRHFTV